ncbi:zinc finger MYM-type protein 5-like, partial [Stegodyphus dumicola]|uniref:zinc finger MYM-type protein 5-like n=1 Tax=Stegodyphus dumicola TaxID=202533 RepID=UPI0015AB6344
MDITEDEQHKEGKEKNQQQYDNNGQQSNVKEKEEDQKQQNMEQPQPEDQEREYLGEDELSNMLSVNYTDPALWGRLSEDKIIDIMKNISNVEVDIQELDFSASKVVYKSQSKYATKMIFYRRLQNGKQQKRNWLLYSNTSGKVYCIPCKLFGSANNPFSA